MIQPANKKELKLDNEFFENVILYHAITNETYLTSIIDVIKPSYFKNDDIRMVIDIITQFYRKRSTIPTTTEIKTHLATEEQKKAFKNVVMSFKQLDSSYNTEELYENTEKFFKEKAVYNAVIDTVNSYSKGTNIDTSNTLSLFQEACGISLVDDLGRNYLDEIDLHCKDLQQTYEYISTGYKWLDQKLAGGFLASGRALYIFSGVTNSGKSIILGNLAANMLSQGKTVIIISLEMPETVYSQRISSQLSRIPIKGLKNQVENLKEFVIKYREKHPGAKLFIKEYPPKGVTVNHIKAYIEKVMMKKKIKPDAIIVDYLGLVQSTVITGNSYTDIKLITEQLRGLSYVFKCPVISAAQLNRSAFDELNPGLETTSESMGLAMTADFQASIWSSESDKELGIIHMGIQKSRFGENFGSHAFKIDYNTLGIDEMDDDFGNNTEVVSAESSLERMLK